MNHIRYNIHITFTGAIGAITALLGVMYAFVSKDGSGAGIIVGAGLGAMVGRAYVNKNNAEV